MNSTSPISNEPVPPTVNELNAEEKAKLLRKTRKLSRVFGEVPSLPTQTSAKHPRGAPNSSTCSFHRRSLSSISTAESQASSRRRRQVARKVPSQPDIRGSISSDAHDHAQPPPLPVSLKHPSQKTNLTTLSAPPTPSTPVQMSPEQIRRARMAKLRRHLGEAIPVELVTCTPPKHHFDDARFRKSIDAVPASASWRSISGKSLRRTRSTVPNLPYPTGTKSQFDSVAGTTREDAVSFHRRHVQNFGLEARAIHSEEREQETRREESKTSEEQQYGPEHEKQGPLTPTSELPTRIQQSRDCGSQDIEEVRSISSISIAESVGFDDSASKYSSGAVVKERDIDQDSILDLDSLKLRSSFQERRRRAAKLTQFFGVGYHDLSASLPASDYEAPTPTRPSQRPTAGVQVDIRMKSKRFWGSGDEYWTCNDADMVEVIDKLRDLKA
ncbi:hypothetical protein VNI00_001440 [Paramarasmius palmivorus]|uniref:Uncharacterized protein n=1 Tax=Paramarasmius palmivorus TaxID=297713 RepID=A0AAW0E328_9AGAR